MLCQKLTHNQPLRVHHKKGFSFSLHNIALDLSSTEAALYLVLNDKQTLIAQLSRNIGGVKSINLALEFNTPDDVVLLSVGGSVHIIGAHKANFGGNTHLLNQKIVHKQKKANAEEMIDQRQSRAKQPKQNKSKPNNQAKIQEKKTSEENICEPLRRSTRARTVTNPIEPANAKEIKRQKQQLKSMAKCLKLKQNELDEDEDQDDSFNKQSEENQQDDDDNEQDKDKQEEDDEQLIQVEEKGISARKKKTEGTKQKERSAQANETTTSREMPQSQSIVQKSPRQKQTAQHFSVPTRNPYI